MQMTMLDHRGDVWLLWLALVVLGLLGFLLLRRVPRAVLFYLPLAGLLGLRVIRDWVDRWEPLPAGLGWVRVAEGALIVLGLLIGLGLPLVGARRGFRAGGGLT